MYIWFFDDYKEKVMLRKFFYLITVITVTVFSVFFGPNLTQAEDYRGSHRDHHDNRHDGDDDDHHRGHGGEELIPTDINGAAIVLSHTCCGNNAIPQYYLPRGYRPPSMDVPALPHQYGAGDMELIGFRIMPAHACDKFKDREDALYACYQG